MDKKSYQSGATHIFGGKGLSKVSTTYLSDQFFTAEILAEPLGCKQVIITINKYSLVNR